METEPKRPPLAESTETNVAKVAPRSKLPTPGKSRIAVPGRRPQPAATNPEPQPASEPATQALSKRKAETDNAPPVKKAKLNTSSSSDPGSGYGAVSRPVRKPSGSAQTSVRPPARKPTAPPSTGTVKTTGRLTAAKPPAPASTAPAKTGGTKKASSKRPAWDYKGRLEDMEAEMSAQSRNNSDLLAQIAETKEFMANLQSVRNDLQGAVTEKSQTVETLERQLRDSQRDLEETSRTLGRKVSDLEFEKSTLERQRSTLQGELSASQQEVSSLKTSVASLSAVATELTSTKSHLEISLAEAKALREELSDLKTKHQEMIDDYEKGIRAHETERRKLHNLVQELKGNIRVFCRVRPLLGDELLGNHGDISHICFPDGTSDKKHIHIDKLDNSSNEGSVSARKGSNSVHEFTFDKVFSPTSQQSEVFEEISQLVQSALDGYHVCIFAYGQTGSGKTYTMEGPPQPDESTEGMIPRAVSQVFSTAQELLDKGWKYKFEVSFMEIYNQQIRDLLGSGKDDVKHDIRMVSANSSEVTVTNLTSVEVTEPSKVHSLLNKAGRNRAVAETKCNSRSSRSHSIFQMKITGRNDDTDESCTGLLNLIDLAGSERLKDSGSEGQRLKETQAINTSLANLGNVIVALANKDPHVPYRNSKLTHVLQHCLGGNSKVLMFANVSPNTDCYSETINSLRFATKVNNCNIGTAQQKK